MKPISPAAQARRREVNELILATIAEKRRARRWVWPAAPEYSSEPRPQVESWDEMIKRALEKDPDSWVDITKPC